MKTTLKIKVDDELNSLYVDMDDLQLKLNSRPEKLDEDKSKLHQLYQTIGQLSRYVNDNEELVLEIDTESKTVNLVEQL